MPPEHPESSLPSVRARVAAFVAILVAGGCGALIGFGLIDVQCNGTCSTAKGVGAVVGPIVGALGVAVVAVLVLRAMGEWRTIQDELDRLRLTEEEGAHREDEP